MHLYESQQTCCGESSAKPVLLVFPLIWRKTHLQHGTWRVPCESLFPIHDYPFQMAEACITARQITREPALALTAQRWVDMLHEPTGALRSHPGENRIDSVDDMGWLMLAMLCIETHSEHEITGLFW